MGTKRNGNPRPISNSGTEICQQVMSVVAPDHQLVKLREKP